MEPWSIEPNKTPSEIARARVEEGSGSQPAPNPSTPAGVDHGAPFSRPWMKTWLRAYRKHHSIVHACKAARKSRATVYRNRREDKRFAAAWDQISETLTDLLEASMLRRATRGVRRPVNMGENGVHYVREFSDAMAYKLLAARRPDPYNRAAGDKGQGQDPRDTATEIREWIAQMRESVPSTQPELESTPTGEAGGTAEPAA